MTTASYSRWVTLAGLASTATAGILILAKLSAWLLTDSSSMLASLTDSLMDISASIINLVVDGKKEQVLLRDFQKHAYKPLVLQPSASQSYYVQVKSTKNRDLSQQYIFYLKGKKYTVPSYLATVSYEKDPINVTASALPFSRKELKKEDSRYQQAYVAIYTAKYKNTAVNGLGLHAGREAKRFYLIRVPDSSFIDKENK